jgi:N-hydroxyarylamine O-acetyltransferase
MPSTPFDLDAYLARIRYSGTRTPTLETLASVHLAHAVSIPFENLNPLLRWPVGLDLATLQQKLVRGGRGGYCFEHNLLFSHALTALGFHVTGLAARVLWNAPDGASRPRGHMLLLVDLDDRAYIADVGFGGLTLTAPLRLEPGVEQTTPHEAFRMVRTGPSFEMQARIEDEFRPLYRFDLQEQLPSDYEVTNWYLSNHPESPFVTGLVAARAESDRRYALRNGDLAIHHRNGDTERHRLTSAAQVLSTLSDIFRISVPDTADLRAAVERLVSRAA